MGKRAFRLVAWNIRAGGGRRVAGIARQIAEWQPDLLALSEYRAGAAGDELVVRLDQLGFVHRRCASAEVGRAKNAVLIASRWPLRQRRLTNAPTEPGRWCCATVSGPKTFSLGVMHIPNQVTGRKPGFHRSLLDLAQTWGRRPALFVGDTNSGKIGLDEERPVFNRATNAWMEDMDAAGFKDLFRHMHGQQREYTWYSANGGNGFRLDQGFANRSFTSWVDSVAHVWGGSGARRDELSDHAALILEARME